MNWDRFLAIVCALLTGVVLSAHWCVHAHAVVVEPVRPPLNDVWDKVTLSQESLSKISQDVWRLLEQHEAVKAAEVP